MRRLGESPTKRPFCYFCVVWQKLPAQLFPELKCGKRVGNTKRLNGTWIPRRAKAATTDNESFAFNGTLRCAYDALRFGFTRMTTMKSVRRDEVARLYGVSESLFERSSLPANKQSMPYDKSRVAKRYLNKLNETFGR